MNKYIITSCEFHLHEDDWNEGEGNLLSVWDQDNFKPADSIKNALKQINYLNCNFKPVVVEEDFEVDAASNRDYSVFDANLLVDVDPDTEQIIKPSDERWKKFENAECKLYSLWICVRMNKISELTEDDLNANGFTL